MSLDDLIGKWQRVEQAAETVIEYARQMTATHVRGMSDDDPHKGIGNRLADAIGEYDAARIASDAAKDSQGGKS